MFIFLKLSSLREIGHIPLSIRTYNTVTSQREELRLDVEEDIEKNDDDLVSIALMTKDKHMIQVCNIVLFYLSICVSSGIFVYIF